MSAHSSARWRTCTLLAALSALAAVHGPILGYKKFADVDEGYAMAIARRLMDGAKLYDGAVSQRGPLMYYGYELLARITGWDNVLGLRCWALGFAAANVALVYWAGARLLSDAAGLIAALATAYALGFGMPTRDAVALHGEAMQLPALLGSAVVGAIAMRCPLGSSARRARLALSGVLMGVSICIKQSVLLHALPLVVWLVLNGRKNRAPARSVLSELGVFSASVAFVPTLFIAHAAAEGTLHELFYYCVSYNLGIHLHPSGKTLHWLKPLWERLNERTLFFTAVVVVAARAFPFVRRRFGAAFE